MVNYAKIAGAFGYGKKRKESSSAKKKRQEAVKKYKASIPKSKKPIDTSYTSKAIGPVSTGSPVKAIASPDKNIARQITKERKQQQQAKRNKSPFAKPKKSTKIVSPVMSATRSNLGRVTEKSKRRQKYLNILQRNREHNAKLKKPSIIGTLNKYILGPKTQIKTKLLTGGQAKIDKDGDGTITGRDFELLRESKKNNMKEGGVTSAIKKIRGIGMAKGGFKKKTPIY